MGTPIVGAGFDPSFGDYTNYNDTGTPRIAGVRKLVWCPHEPIVTVYESTPNYVHNNWEKRQNTMNGFGNFLLFRRCGDILDRSATSGTREAWWWSYGGTNDLNPSAPVAAWGTSSKA